MVCVMQEAKTDDLMVPPGPKKYLQIMVIDEIYMPCILGGNKKLRKGILP